MRPFYPVGLTTSLSYVGHNETQAAKLAILMDIAYGLAYGWGVHTRLPTPGATLPAARIEKRLGQMEAGWRGEQNRVPGTRGVRASDMTPLAQAHYAERLLEYPQTQAPLGATNWERDE